MQVYIYTKRDVRRNKVAKYSKEIKPFSLYNLLIPKLFGENTVLQHIYNKYNFVYSSDIENQTCLFSKLLNDKTNFIWNEYNIIKENDKQKIIEMNLKAFVGFNNKQNPKKHFEQFILHLFKGHGPSMYYGLYFSIIYANNDIDFIDKIKTCYKLSEISGENQSIIYYCKLNDLIEHLKKTKDFTSPLLYLNPEWDFGVPRKDTLYWDKNNPIKFIEDIKEKYKVLELQPKFGEVNPVVDPELICQIPLPVELFKPIFIINEKQYYNKYLKYKKKYIKLKQIYYK